MKKLIAIALLAAPSLALAQTQPVTKVNLGEEQVSSKRQAPLVETLVERPEVKHSGLIHLRNDFAERILASSKELR